MPAVPLDIVDIIVDILAKGVDNDQDEDDASNDDLALVKTFSLVCRAFLPLCPSRKRIFASIQLDNKPILPGLGRSGLGGTISMLYTLLCTSPVIAGYIRELYYNIRKDDFKDSAITLQTFKQFKQLTSLFLRYKADENIDDDESYLIWNDNPLRPALLHVLQLPSLREFHVSCMNNFILADLVPCINLEEFSFLRLKTTSTPPSELPTLPIRLRSLVIGLGSVSTMTRMCAEKCADGTSFVDFSKLTELSVTCSIVSHGEVSAVQSLGSLCTGLVKLNVYVSNPILNFAGLSKMLLPSRQTLKHVDIQTIFSGTEDDDPLQGLTEELELMGNDNIIEEVIIDFNIIDKESDCNRGDFWGRLDKVFAEAKWPMLRRVSLSISGNFSFRHPSFGEQLRDLPNTQFHWLSSTKSLGFVFEVHDFWWS